MEYVIYYARHACRRGNNNAVRIREGHYDEKRDNARCLIAAKSVVPVTNVATLQSVSPVFNVYWTEIAEFCAATYNQR